MANNRVEEEEEEEQYGVVLYYKYTSVPDLNSLATFYDSNCNSLGLLGRVRLAPHGVNVTVSFSFSLIFSILSVWLPGKLRKSEEKKKRNKILGFIFSIGLVSMKWKDPKF